MNSSVGIHLFKVNSGNTKIMCKICSKLTIKKADLCQLRSTGVFIVNFEQISHIVLDFPLLTLSKLMSTDFLKNGKRR